MDVCWLIIGPVLWRSPGYHEKLRFTYAGIIDIVAGFLVATTALNLRLTAIR